MGARRLLATTLTPRQRSILVFVYLYGGCFIEHIRRHFFRSPGARSACYASVAQLVENGFLRAARLPARHGIGSGKAFVSIGQRARPIVGEALRLSPSELRRLRDIPTPSFIEHHAAVCDLRLSLELACADPLEWIDETTLKRTPVRLVDSSDQTEIVLIPDGIACLRLGDHEERCWVAVDMGTMGRARMSRRLRGYLLRSRQFDDPVLVAVPDSRRMAEIERWAAAEAKATSTDASIFLLTSHDLISEQTVLAAPIWRVSGTETPVAIEDLLNGTSNRQGADATRGSIRFDTRQGGEAA